MKESNDFKWFANNNEENTLVSQVQCVYFPPEDNSALRPNSLGKISFSALNRMVLRHTFPFTFNFRLSGSFYAEIDFQTNSTRKRPNGFQEDVWEAVMEEIECLHTTEATKWKLLRNGRRDQWKTLALTQLLRVVIENKRLVKESCRYLTKVLHLHNLTPPKQTPTLSIWHLAEEVWETNHFLSSKNSNSAVRQKRKSLYLDSCVFRSFIKTNPVLKFFPERQLFSDKKYQKPTSCPSIRNKSPSQ